MPPPRTQSEVDFTSETTRTENILREACVTRSYMDEHADPELGAAAQAQDGLQEATQNAPQDYRTQEAEALQNARGGASQAGREGVSDLFENRATSFATVGNDQGAASTENARKRQEVATEVNTIFTETQTAVTDRLDTMTTDVTTTFDTEANAAVSTFEDFIRTNAEIYEKNWLEDLVDLLSDKLFDSPPAEVWDFYGEGRRAFIAEMRVAIGNVADIVETGLREAKELVEDGKRRVEEKLSTLGDDLADFRSEISDQMNERFSGLEGDINRSQSELVTGLGQRYARALESVRNIEQQVRDEYSTWVDSARDAYNAAVDFITGWIDRLTSIVGDAATRIMRQPGQFLRNLGAGILQGLTMFMDNIGNNIRSAVVTWLTGNLGSAGIEVPTTFDAKSLIGFAMELVGLGLTNIKDIARRVFGRRIVAMIEAGAAGFEHIKRLFDILVNEGPAGLYDHLRAEFERIKGEMMEKIGQALAQSLVVAGIRKALGLLSGLLSGGAGTVITIVSTIIDVVLWFRDNAAQLAELVSTIASTALAVLNGNVGVLAGAINTVLQRLLPVALSFVGALVGIGGAVRRIQQIFRAIRRPATRAITALFRRLKRGVQRLLRRLRRRRGRGRGRRRGRERPMSPMAVVRAIARELKRPGRERNPARALAAARRKANQLRSRYQRRLQRGRIRITILDSSPNQVTTDGDIDFEVSVNPRVRDAQNVLVDIKQQFRPNINASHARARQPIERSLDRISVQQAAHINDWPQAKTALEAQNPVRDIVARPALASHQFGNAMGPHIEGGVKDADSAAPNSQITRVKGLINSGTANFRAAKDQLITIFYSSRASSATLRRKVKEGYEAENAAVPNERGFPSGFNGERVRADLYEGPAGWVATRRSFFSTRIAAIRSRIDNQVSNYDAATSLPGSTRAQKINSFGVTQYWQPWDSVRGVKLPGADMNLFHGRNATRAGFSIARARAGGYFTQSHGGTVHFDVDHKAPLVQHWNRTGFNSGQGSRNSATTRTSNLQVVSSSLNRSKGGLGGNYKLFVGPNFTGGGATNTHFQGTRWVRR
ncbi:hypothetical protein ACERZ8_09620 [Tateyamaria armeniaca]|uniref:Uncharacterized protein n=1 Tax=Tateyamaria armeniaca TaxID=2518930 RepID=A0ABW8USK9_9RHOB